MPDPLDTHTATGGPTSGSPCTTVWLSEFSECRSGQNTSQGGGKPDCLHGPARCGCWASSERQRSVWHLPGLDLSMDGGIERPVWVLGEAGHKDCFHRSWHDFSCTYSLACGYFLRLQHCHYEETFCLIMPSELEAPREGPQHSPPRVMKRDSTNHAFVNRGQPSGSSSNVLAKPDEDWTKITDPIERRKAQNRNAQRRYQRSIISSSLTAQHKLTSIWPEKQTNKLGTAPKGRASSCSRVVKSKQRTPHAITDPSIHKLFASENRDLGAIHAPADSNESVLDTRNTLATNSMTTLSLQCLPWESPNGDQCGDF